jgi:hypothetical protein
MKRERRVLGLAYVVLEVLEEPFSRTVEELRVV